jgi:DNA helicase II / ATP-dependent DNA helicase PcrA
MDKTVVFAVAGSGKTFTIVEELDANRRFLIVTYTEANKDNLHALIIQKFGHFPANICLYTYFTFLHSFCYRPFLLDVKRTKGITFRRRQAGEREYPLTSDRRYMTANGWLYHNRLAKFLEQTNTVNDVIARIEKYFDAFFIDEVQDFGGHDFNLLISLCQTNVHRLFVGDFYQHTFDTSRDGNVNVRLHDDYEAYKRRFRAVGMNIDLTSLVRSRRCSESVCNFVTEALQIRIKSHAKLVTTVRFTDDPAEVQTIFDDPSIVKLFLKEHYTYSCRSQNWGASKGLQYRDVCVVLHPGGVSAWKKGTLHTLSPETRNKLYVACTRASGNLTFIPESLLKKHRRD